MQNLSLFEEQRHSQVALKFVTTRRAALLLGISEEELLRISDETGLGQREVAGREEDVFFTYEELNRIGEMSSLTIH
jgi:hypothetical protein